jgi:hypothetical protein
VVACVFGRPPFVRADRRLLPVVGVEGTGDPRACGTSSRSCAGSRGGRSCERRTGCAWLRCAASLAPAARGAPLDIPASPARTSTCRSRSRGSRRPSRAGEPAWGYRRIVGELHGLGIGVSASSVRSILIRHRLPPAPERDGLSWRLFLRQQAASMLARDFLTVETVWLTRIYVLFVVSLEHRRIEFVASTSNPDGRWVAQQACNLLLHLADQEQSFRFLLHDRDSKFSGAFDEVSARATGRPSARAAGRYSARRAHPASAAHRRSAGSPSADSPLPSAEQVHERDARPAADPLSAAAAPTSAVWALGASEAASVMSRSTRADLDAEGSG